MGSRISALTISTLCACLASMSLGATPEVAIDVDAIAAEVQQDLLSGWKLTRKDSTLELTSPAMELAPSQAAGLPPGHVTRPFVMRLQIGPKLTLIEHKAQRDISRAHYLKYERLGKSAPRLVQWLPDYYGDSYAISVGFPNYVPASGANQKEIGSLFDRVTKRWRVYPHSSHSRVGTYAQWLELGM